MVQRGGTVRASIPGDGSSAEFLDIAGRVSTARRGRPALDRLRPRYQPNGLFYAYYTRTAATRSRSTSSRRAQRHGRQRALAPQGARRSAPRATRTTRAARSRSAPAATSTPRTGDGGAGGDPQGERPGQGRAAREAPAHQPARQRRRRLPVPQRNPFDGRKGRDEIYAMGLRNPFRFSFDPPTGRIAIGDVGQFRWEEVDIESRKSLRAPTSAGTTSRATTASTAPATTRRRGPARHDLRAAGSRVPAQPGQRDHRGRGGPRPGPARAPGPLPLRRLRQRQAALVQGEAVRRAERPPLGVSVADPTSFASGPNGPSTSRRSPTGRLFRLVPDSTRPRRRRVRLRPAHGAARPQPSSTKAPSRRATARRARRPRPSTSSTPPTAR